MKRIIKNSLYLFLMFFIFGCTAVRNNKISPQKVSDSFFKYLNNYEYDKARELGTEQTKKIIGLVETLSKMGGGGKIILKDSKSEFINCEIRGKEAVCNYKTFSGDIQQVYLLKQNGHWLVDLRKNPE